YITAPRPTHPPPASLHDALPVYFLADEHLPAAPGVAALQQRLEVAKRTPLLLCFLAQQSEDPRRLAPQRRGQPVERWPQLGLGRSEEHTSELQSLTNLVCRHLLV